MQHTLFTVIWCRTYSKGPIRYQERKLTAATTYATFCMHNPTNKMVAYIAFYMHHPTDKMVHTMAFVIPAVEHWLE